MCAEMSRPAATRSCPVSGEDLWIVGACKPLHFPALLTAHLMHRVRHIVLRAVRATQDIRAKGGNIAERAYKAIPNEPQRRHELDRPQLLLGELGKAFFLGFRSTSTEARTPRKGARNCGRHRIYRLAKPQVHNVVEAKCVEGRLRRRETAPLSHRHKAPGLRGWDSNIATCMERADTQVDRASSDFRGVEKDQKLLPRLMAARSPFESFGR